MRKRELKARIEALEARVAHLEGRPWYTVWNRCTCNDPWFGITPPPPCPVHGDQTWKVAPCVWLSREPAGYSVGLGYLIACDSWG